MLGRRSCSEVEFSEGSAEEFVGWPIFLLTFARTVVSMALLSPQTIHEVGSYAEPLDSGSDELVLVSDGVDMMVCRENLELV